MSSAAGKDNPIVLAACGVLAYGASMATHEALGHGIYCLAHGGENLMLTAWGERCSMQLFGIEAAGPLVQFAAGLTCWAALHRVARERVNLRSFLWLVMAYCLLVSTGYLVFSGIAGFGDAAVLLAGLEPALVWRGGLILGGVILFYLAMRATAFELHRFAGEDDGAARLRRLVWIPYLSAGVLAIGGALANRTEDPLIALELAAASSFGAGIGLLPLPGMPSRGVAGLKSVYVRFSTAWIAAGVIGAIAFVLLLGRGIELSAA